jgi:hypothetical protein
MADDVPDTFGGGLRSYIGAIGFIVPLVGFEQLVTGWVGMRALSWPYSVALMFLGIPIYFAPAIWKRILPDQGMILGDRLEQQNLVANTGGLISAVGAIVPMGPDGLRARAESGGRIILDGSVGTVVPRASAPVEFIPLDKAARIVWESIQESAFAENLENTYRAPSAILNSLSCQFLARGIVWGQKFPSAQMTQISQGKLFYVLPDGTSLAYASQTEAIIQQASVKPDDLDEYVRYAKNVSVRI